MIIFIIILAYLAIALYEILLLYKKKQRKEIWLYSFLMLFSFSVTVLIAAGIKLPKTVDIVEKIFSYLIKE